MTQVLRQSTAVDVLVGPFVDLTDGSTAETGESPTVKLSKNGQALAAKNDATTPVHDADGYYNCELDATDTNTVGTLVLTVAASANALPVRHEFQVVEEAAYDAIYASSANPKTGLTVSTIGSGVITATSIASNAITAAKIATDAITAAKLASDAVTEIQSGLATSAEITALNDISAADVLAAGDIDGYTLEEFGKLALAALVGKLSGAATTTVTIRSADDTVDRVVATVDADGNRSAVTLTETG